MWPFKPRISLGSLCGEFYATCVFQPMSGVKGPLIWDAVYAAIARADYSFAAVEERRFIDEFNALRVELFALAWAHKFKSHELVAHQTLFTWKYLNDVGRQWIWSTMWEYTQAILASAQETGDNTGTRQQIHDALVRRGIDEVFVSSITARFGTQEAWRRGATSRYLALKLQERLGTQLNPAGNQQLLAAIDRLYNEARNIIRSFRVVSPYTPVEPPGQLRIWEHGSGGGSPVLKFVGFLFFLAAVVVFMVLGCLAAFGLVHYLKGAAASRLPRLLAIDTRVILSCPGNVSEIWDFITRDGPFVITSIKAVEIVCDSDTGAGRTHQSGNSPMGTAPLALLPGTLPAGAGGYTLNRMLMTSPSWTR